MEDNINADLELECPVCFESLRAPIYQCHNGHLLCCNCIRMINKCPICRERMPKRSIRNREMEQASVARTFSCPNEGQGCLDVNKHNAMDCEFATITLTQPVCKKSNYYSSTQNFCTFIGIHNCDQEVSKKNLIEHLTSSHLISGKAVPNGEEILIEQSGFFNENRRDAPRWNPHFISYENLIFFIITKFHSGKLTWLVFILGSKDSARKFCFKIKLLGADETDNKDLYLKWGGTVLPLKEDWEEEYLSHMFHMDMQQLKKFWNEIRPGETRWKLKISIRRKINNCRNHQREIQTLLSEPTDGKLPNMPFLTHETAKRVRLGRRRIGRGIQESEIHEENVSCDCCKTVPIVGPRYKCIECEDFDLCSTCVEAHVHAEHLFLVSFTRNQRNDLQKLFLKYKELMGFARAPKKDKEEPICSGCGEDPLIGPRYVCTNCEELNLCQTCAHDGIHCEHLLLVAYSVVALRKLQQCFNVDVVK